MDILVPIPLKIRKQSNIPGLLKDLGFIVQFNGMKGWMKLAHPELIIEFLVPKRDRDSDRLYSLAQLGMNAQPLSFMDMLIENMIRIKIENFYLQVPHPAAFALHKLIISKRRMLDEKKDKDIMQALNVLNALIEKGEKNNIRKIFKSLFPKWQKKVMDALKDTKVNNIRELLK